MHKPLSNFTYFVSVYFEASGRHEVSLNSQEGEPITANLKSSSRIFNPILIKFPTKCIFQEHNSWKNYAFSFYWNI